MTNAPRSDSRRVLKLLLLIPLLLAIAIAANWASVQQIVRKERTLKSIIYGSVNKDATALAGLKLPEPIGAKDAKVVVEVFLAQGDPCHVESVFTGRAIGKLDPKRILVKFGDTHDPAVAKRTSTLKLGCMQAMTVNGQSKFTVPGPRTAGGGVMGGHGSAPPPGTAGSPSPAGGNAVMAGPGAQGGEDTRKDHVVYLTAQSHWTHSDLHWILDSELKKAYKGKGLAMSAAELQDAMKQSATSARTAAEAEAKGTEAGK